MIYLHRGLRYQPPQPHLEVQRSIRKHDDLRKRGLASVRVVASVRVRKKLWLETSLRVGDGEVFCPGQIAEDVFGYRHACLGLFEHRSRSWLKALRMP